MGPKHNIFNTASKIRRKLTGSGMGVNRGWVGGRVGSTYCLPKAPNTDPSATLQHHGSEGRLAPQLAVASLTF